MGDICRRVAGEIHKGLGDQLALEQAATRITQRGVVTSAAVTAVSTILACPVEIHMPGRPGQRIWGRWVQDSVMPVALAWWHGANHGRLNTWHHLLSTAFVPTGMTGVTPGPPSDMNLDEEAAGPPPVQWWSWETRRLAIPTRFLQHILHDHDKDEVVCMTDGIPFRVEQTESYTS